MLSLVFPGCLVLKLLWLSSLYVQHLVEAFQLYRIDEARLIELERLRGEAEARCQQAYEVAKLFQTWELELGQVKKAAEEATKVTERWLDEAKAAKRELEVA